MEKTRTRTAANTAMEETMEENWMVKLRPNMGPQMPEWVRILEDLVAEERALLLRRHGLTGVVRP